MKTVIIGSGFAGLSAAKKLSSRYLDTDIVIYDKNSYSSMLPALPDLASGSIRKKRIMADLFSRTPDNLLFLNRIIRKINLIDKTITDEKGKYHYDRIIIAPGSVTNFYEFNNNSSMLYTLSSVEDAVKLYHCIKVYCSMRKKAHIVISGGGYTGLETAVSLRKFLGYPHQYLKITVIETGPTILPFLKEEDRSFILRRMEKMRVSLKTNHKPEAFDGHNVSLSSGEVIEDVFFIWSAGSRFPDIEITGDIPQISDGRIKVSEDLSIPGYHDAFAVGDAAAIEIGGSILRKAVNMSIKSGAHAALNIIRDIDGKERKKFSYTDPGWILPLGNASVGYLYNKIRLRGKKAQRLHYFMCGLRNYSLSNFMFFLKKALLPSKKPKSRT